MVIHELSRDECLRALAGARVGRLGCARDGQPYVVPISFAYHKAPDGESYLYGFTTPGQKVEWMRANPRVCVEWDDVTALDRWVSVIAFGRYEELPVGPDGCPPPQTRTPLRATPAPGETEGEPEWKRAHALLREQLDWWQPAAAAYAAREHRDPREPFHPVYYRIHIGQVTGHRAGPEPHGPPPAVPARDRADGGWFRRALRRVSGRVA